MSTVLQQGSSSANDFVRLMRWRAEHTPERHAFSFLNEQGLEHRRLSYAQADHEARAVAAMLQAHGLTGERAVLLFQPSAEYVLSLLGCWYAGVTAVPVYAPRLNASLDRVRLIVDNAQAAAILSTSQVFATMQDDTWQALRAQGLAEIAVDAIPADAAAHWQQPDVTENTLAALQYTSGSTGQPKGVRLLHRNLITNSRMIARTIQSDADSVGVMWIPPYHDMGLIGGILQPFYSGYPVYLMTPATFLQRPMRWLEAISRFDATNSAAPNFAYELCVKRAKPDQIAALDLSSWRTAANGAEPIRAETLDKFCATFAPAGFKPGAFFPCYGMAETTLLVSGSPLGRGAVTLEASRGGLAAGTLAQGTDDAITLAGSGPVDPEAALRIVDPFNCVALDTGQIGEIWVQGPTVADGYWNNREATAVTFEATLAGESGHWLRTGDLGCLRDGELYVTGRIKDLIIIRGHNHYPHDIEATALAAHPALRPHGAAAFAVETADGEGLGLMVELDRGWQPDDLAAAEVAIRDAISRAHQLQPAVMLLVRANTVPKTSSGKIQRLQARARWLAGEITPLSAEVPA
ncbi:fatty acyl-AMP ligase [Chitinibacteraceae bacterium HSL-7]